MTFKWNFSSKLKTRSLFYLISVCQCCYRRFWSSKLAVKQKGHNRLKKDVNKVLREIMPGNLVYLLSFHLLNLLHLVVYDPRMPFGEGCSLCWGFPGREGEASASNFDANGHWPGCWMGWSISKTLFSVRIERFSFQGRWQLVEKNKIRPFSVCKKLLILNSFTQKHNAPASQTWS